MKKHHKHKNKFIKKQKHKAQKAFSKPSAQMSDSSSEILATPVPATKISPAVNSSLESSTFKLPVAEIKKDLLGTIIFAIFAVAALFIMHLYNFGFADVQRIVSSLVKF